MLRFGLTCAAIVLAACGPRASSSRPNLLIVMVDTLRADQLGAYGFSRPTSPSFDRFAAQSTLFVAARSQASCTFPSVNSLLTSRYGARFLGQSEAAPMAIPADMPVLPEILRTHGYATAAVTASPIVRRSPTRFNPGGGFARGFESFDESCLWQPAACVNGKAFAALDALAGRAPFFLYLHYIDPHGPYSPPPDFPRQFGAHVPDKDYLQRGDPNPLAKLIYEGHPEQVDPADAVVLRDLYDDEIHYFDSQLAVLLAELERRGLGGNTVIVFTADHGEEFLEHGDVKHCRNVFDVEIKVPLAIRVPGRAPARVDRPVETLGVAPTLLDLAGIDAVPYGFEGSDLLAAPPAALPPAFSAQGSRRAATLGHLKLIHDLGDGSFALYDLAADPGESHDTLRQHAEEFRELRRLLFAWIERVEGPMSQRSLDAAKATELQLKSLGYLQ